MGREPTKVIWANCRTRSVQAAKETSMATEERAMAMRERRQEKRTLKHGAYVQGEIHRGRYESCGQVYTGHF